MYWPKIPSVFSAVDTGIAGASLVAVPGLGKLPKNRRCQTKSWRAKKDPAYAPPPGTSEAASTHRQPELVRSCCTLARISVRPQPVD